MDGIGTDPRLKRLVDLTGAVIGLVILSPLVGVIAVAIKLDTPGPVFYRAERVGVANSSFTMYKFRNMFDHAKGPSSSPAGDPRVTRVGRVLRRLKLDEIPQLWNVLLGDMSLVGPRPNVRWAVDRYSAQEARLTSIRPGLTDYASLRFRDEGERLRGSADPDGDYLRLIAPEKARLALAYLDRSSTWEDLRIVAATLGALVGFDPEWCIPSAAENP